MEQVKKYMADESSELLFIVEYILKRASSQELPMIRAALEARAAQGPRSLDDLNFREMAKNMTEEITKRFGLGNNQNQIHGMTRRLVTNMIRDNVPEISERDLNILLDQWVEKKPAGQSSAGKEEYLPPEAVMSMIDQFVRYSLNKMPSQELNELKRSMPDWAERYWGIFSMETRSIIRSLLKAEMNTDEFWSRIRQKLDRRKS